MKPVLGKKFFVFNPKSYLCGEDLLRLAKEADKLAEQYPELTVFVTCPYADIQNVAQATRHVMVTAQHIDSIVPGRGMGAVLPEAVFGAGARATFLNHAERPLSLASLVKGIQRVTEMGMISIVCADSVQEAQAIAILNPDIILCEPTELIGAGVTSDKQYIQQTNEAIKQVNTNVRVMQAAGISTPEDVYRMISLGADGTGCTSGIVRADNPVEMLQNMVAAVWLALQETEA